MAYTSFVIATNPPAAYYRMDDSSGVVATDSSINSLDANYVGTPTLGEVGGIFDPNSAAVLLDGSTQYIDCGTQLDTAISNFFSLSLYVLFTTLPLDQETYTLIDSDDRFELVALRDGVNDGIYIYLPGHHTNKYDGPFIPMASVGTTSFLNVCVTYDQILLKIFLNGVLADSEPITGALQVAGGNGTFIGSSNVLDNFLPGAIDEVGFFPSAISERTVALNFYALQGEKYYRAAVLSMFPKTYLMLDETSGVTAFDKSLNSNNGTYQGNPTLDSAGKFSGGVAFDPSTFDFIDLGLPLGTGSGGEKTIAFFVKPNIFTTTQYLIANKNIGSGGFSVILNTDGTIGLSWTVSENVVQTVETIPASDFSHIIVTFAADNTGKIAIDGKILASGSLGSESTSNNRIRASGQWSTFNLGSDSLFDGNIDEIAIYDWALSPSEIIYLYYFGNIEYPFYDNMILNAGAIAYWPMDEITGNFIDRTANGHDLVSYKYTIYRDQLPLSNYIAERATRFKYVSGCYLYPLNGPVFPSTQEDDYTFEAWIYVSVTYATTLTDIFIYNTTGIVRVEESVSGLRSIAYDDAAYSLSSNELLPQSANTHFVMTRERINGSNYIKYYINGQLKWTGDIGQHVFSYQAVSQLFRYCRDFTISNLAIYPTALDDAEVLKHYNAAVYDFGFISKVSGTVYDDNETPIESNLRVYNATSGEYIKSAVNDSLSGFFSIDMAFFTDVFVHSIPVDIARRSTVHGPLAPEVV